MIEINNNVNLYNNNLAILDTSADINQQKIETSKQTEQRKDPLSTPTQDASKAAQQSSDLMVSSGVVKTLEQIVIEKNIPGKDTNDPINVGSAHGNHLTSASSLGTTMEVPPAEVNDKQNTGHSSA